jgi:hypothetical protein
MFKFLETIEPILPIKFSQRTIYKVGPQKITKSWSVESEQGSSQRTLFSLCTGMLRNRTEVPDIHNFNFQMDFSQELVDHDVELDSVDYMTKIWIDDQIYWARLVQNSLSDFWALEIPQVSLGVTGGEISGTVTLRGQNLTLANQFSKVSLDSYSMG